MASVEKRGKNSWRAIISVGLDPAKGEYRIIKQPIKAKNKKEAQRQADEIELSIIHGDYIEPTKLTLGEYLNEWLKTRKLDLKETTWDNYRIIVEAHLIPSLGNLPLQRINPFTIQNYISQKLTSGRRDGKGGLSSRSVQYHIRILSEALEYAVYPLKLIKDNCAKKVTKPTVEKKEMKALNINSIVHLLTVAKNTTDFHWYALLFTAVFTGMRRGELLGLSWDDVDFENGLINVKRTLQKKPGGEKGEIKFYTPKTKKSKRPIVLMKQNIAILRALKKEQAKNKLQMGADYLNEFNLVFCHSNGSPITPDSLRHKYETIIAKASLKLRFHDLRHSHATLLLAAGIDVKIAGDRLGHTSSTITHDIYEHVETELQALELGKLETLIQDKLSSIM